MERTIIDELESGILSRSSPEKTRISSEYTCVDRPAVFCFPSRNIGLASFERARPKIVPITKSPINAPAKESKTVYKVR